MHHLFGERGTRVHVRTTEDCIYITLRIGFTLSWVVESLLKQRASFRDESHDDTAVVPESEEDRGALLAPLYI